MKRRRLSDLTGRLLLLGALGALLLAPDAAGQAPRVGIVRKEPTIPQMTYGRVAARELGLELLKVEAVTHRGRVPSGKRIFGKGPSVQLDGASLTRLLFDNPGQPLDYLMHLVRPRRSPMLADARGSQLVLVEGERLAEPGFAARALQIAWGGGVLARPRAGIQALRAVSPPELEGEQSGVEFASVVVLARADTPAYALMLERLRVARNVSEAEEPPDEFAVEFHGVNHFSYTSTTGLPSYSEVLLSKQGSVSGLARDLDQVSLLLDYTHEVLDNDAMTPDDGPVRDAMLKLLRRILRRIDPEPEDALGRPRGS
jgi:hypothetical protein